MLTVELLLEMIFGLENWLIMNNVNHWWWWYHYACIIQKRCL